MIFIFSQAWDKEKNSESLWGITLKHLTTVLIKEWLLDEQGHYKVLNSKLLPKCFMLP